jgi:hypothetical protein
MHWPPILLTTFFANSINVDPTSSKYDSCIFCSWLFAHQKRCCGWKKSSRMALVKGGQLVLCQHQSSLTWQATFECPNQLLAGRKDARTVCFPPGRRLPTHQRNIQTLLCTQRTSALTPTTEQRQTLWCIQRTTALAPTTEQRCSASLVKLSSTCQLAACEARGARGGVTRARKAICDGDEDTGGVSPMMMMYLLTIGPSEETSHQSCRQ